MESSARKILAPLRSAPRCALPLLPRYLINECYSRSLRSGRLTATMRKVPQLGTPPKFFPALKNSQLCSVPIRSTPRGEFFEGKNFVKLRRYTTYYSEPTRKKHSCYTLCGGFPLKNKEKGRRFRQELSLFFICKMLSSLQAQAMLLPELC